MSVYFSLLLDVLAAILEETRRDLEGDFADLDFEVLNRELEGNFPKKEQAELVRKGCPGPKEGGQGFSTTREELDPDGSKYNEVIVTEDYFLDEDWRLRCCV